MIHSCPKSPALAFAKWHDFRHNGSRLGSTLGGGSRLRDTTKETIIAVIRHLRAGQSPKEVARTLNITWSCVQQIIYRHQTVRTAYIDTYNLRHPNQEKPPEKILRPLRQVEL